MEALAALVAGGAVFFFLAYMVRARALRPAESRLRVLSAATDVATAPSSGGLALLRREPTTLVSRILKTSDYAQRWQFDLERADLRLRPSEYFLLRLMLGLGTVGIISLIGRNGVAFVISLPLAAVVYMLPAYWLGIRIQRRRLAIERQLEETTMLIAGALRAGFAFAQGIDVAAKRMGPPMSAELGRLLLDIGLGMSTEDALEGMNQRIVSDDLDMVVTAILIQRSSGGNLAEVLEQVADTIRDRERIRGEIRTLTASQRFTAWVLSAWPVALAAVFYLINPDVMSLLWKEPVGIVLLIIWGGLNLTGVVILRKILDIDI